MKYLNKTTLMSMGIGIILSLGIGYAATNITTLNQTAQQGDIMTNTWVNAVNTSLTSLSASSGNNRFCVRISNQNDCVQTFQTYGRPISYVHPMDSKVASSNSLDNVERECGPYFMEWYGLPIPPGYDYKYILYFCY